MSRSFLIVLPKETAGRDAKVKTEIDLAHAGGVEGGIECGETRDDLGGGVRLHGIIDARLGKRAGQLVEIMRDDVDIDDEAGRGNAGGGEIARDLRWQSAAFGGKFGRLGHKVQRRLAATTRLRRRGWPAGGDRRGGGFGGDARTGTAALFGSEHRKHPFSDPVREPA